MGRIKPAALLRQSKKQKGPARPSVTAIAGSLCFLLVVLLSVAFVSRQRGQHDLDRSPQYAVFNTTKGLLTLQLSDRHEAKAVESFVSHSQNGDYKGWRFYKGLNFLVIQGGDQDIDGIDGSSLDDVKVEDETGAGGLKYERFTLALENLGPNSNSSRFFVTTTDTPHLSSDKHVVIGRFVGDLSVLQDMEYSLTDKSQQPLERVVIHNILSL